MSVAVGLGELGAHVDERGLIAYLLTVGDDGRPHAVSVAIDVDGGAFRCDAGNRTSANAAARPAVSLLWPNRTPEDYSLIVDGEAAVVGAGTDRRVVITPTRAVLHRAAGCAPIDLPAH
jgi:hypothetical protein